MSRTANTLAHQAKRKANIAVDEMTTPAKRATLSVEQQEVTSNLPADLILFARKVRLMRVDSADNTTPYSYSLRFLCEQPRCRTRSVFTTSREACE